MSGPVAAPASAKGAGEADQADDEAALASEQAAGRQQTAEGEGVRGWRRTDFHDDQREWVIYPGNEMRPLRDLDVPEDD